MLHSDHVHGRSTSSLVACLACDDEDYARQCPAEMAEQRAHDVAWMTAAERAELGKRDAELTERIRAYVPRIKRPADPFAVFDAMRARETGGAW